MSYKTLKLPNLAFLGVFNCSSCSLMNFEFLDNKFWNELNPIFQPQSVINCAGSTPDIISEII